jgi:hypothetical protein
VSTFSEAEIVAVLRAEADSLAEDMDRRRYKKAGAYGARKGRHMKDLAIRAERLRGAYSFAATVFRSKDRTSGHSTETAHHVLGIVSRAQDVSTGRRDQ